MKDKKCVVLFAMMLWASTTLLAQDAVADNMLVYQRSVGGWPKQINAVKVDYTKQLSEKEKAGIKADSLKKDATIDNNATTKEIRYLLKAYSQTGNRQYLSAAEKGIAYLIVMQHDNGGWPQYYPDFSLYRSEITYNDNAMMNAMNVLWDVVHRSPYFEGVDSSFISLSERAIARGIDCILKTQLKLNGKLTAWCAQYDRKTMQPAKARAFELPSLCVGESVGIVEFLIKVKNPSPEIKAAVSGAVEWFNSVKIEGYNCIIINDSTQPKGKDRVLVPEEGSTIWARFYDIETGKPIFVGRDSQVHWNLAEIENERRYGYAWYGTWPAGLLQKKYPKWVALNQKSKVKSKKS